MKARILGIAALAALASVTACKKGGDNGGESTSTTADTSVVQGTDTVQKTVNQVVPTTDTVVKTTETTVDTTKGHGADTTHAATTDTTKKM